MEWPFKDPDFDEQDLENVLKYDAGKSVALLRSCGSRVSAQYENVMFVYRGL